MSISSKRRVLGVGTLVVALMTVTHAQGQAPARGRGIQSDLEHPILSIGSQAPDFALPGVDGKIHKLSDSKGKTLVLAWFPKAFTGG